MVGRRKEIHPNVRARADRNRVAGIGAFAVFMGYHE